MEVNSQSVELNDVVIAEVIVKGGVVLDYIMSRCFSNVLSFPFTYTRVEEY